MEINFLNEAETHPLIPEDAQLSTEKIAGLSPAIELQN